MMPLTNEIQCGTSGGDQDCPSAAILEAVMSLSETYRETLILRLVEGMTGPEIAARTGMTHGSVRVNLHRGMEQLRAKLSREPEPRWARTGEVLVMDTGNNRTENRPSIESDDYLWDRSGEPDPEIQQSGNVTREVST